MNVCVGIVKRQEMRRSADFDSGPFLQEHGPVLEPGEFERDVTLLDSKVRIPAQPVVEFVSCRVS